MVPKYGKYFGRLFCTEIGVTQGYPVSPNIFNVKVDTFIRVVLLEVCGPQMAHQGLGWSVGEHNIFFCADDGRIVGPDPFWVQTTLMAMVRMFKKVGLQTNLGKTKSMVCIPGFIWGQQGEAA